MKAIPKRPTHEDSMKERKDRDVRDCLMLNCMRLIGPCLVSGQTAGAAAAVSMRNNRRSRDLDVMPLQTPLRKHGAHLG